MKSIQIKDSYKIWKPSKMKHEIELECWSKYCWHLANEILHRSYVDMYIEWWLHNILYYLTRNIPLFESIAERCKDVDLEEHI